MSGSPMTDIGMMTAWLDFSSDGPAPPSWLQGNTAQFSEILYNCSVETVDAALLRFSASGDYHFLSAAHNVQARKAITAGDTAAAIASLKLSLAANPAQIDMRLLLAGVTAGQMDAEELVKLLEPVVDILFSNLRMFAPDHLSWLIVASDFCGRRDLVGVLSARAALADDDAIIFSAPAKRILGQNARAQLSARFGGSNVSDAVLTVARQSATEHALVQVLSGLRWVDSLAEASPETIGALIDLCRRRRWNRAYRLILQIVVRAIGQEPTGSSDHRDLSSCLPPHLRTLLVNRTANSDPRRWQEACSTFAAKETLTTAQHAWQTAYQTGNSAALLRGGVIEPDLMEAARQAEHVAESDPSGVPVWFFITWREHAARLLSDLAMLSGAPGRRMVSIGGDGKPEDLAVAMMGMLVPDVYLLNRAPISWGGPRLLFQTVLEGMSVFRRLAPAQAWMQVVCDRTFPMIGMAELSQRLADKESFVAFGFGRAVPAWTGELSDAQVENLPNELKSALDDIFRASDVTRFLHLSGPWSMIPDEDYRLRYSSFNFSSSALPISDDQRLGNQFYGVSGYDADLKWMSLARIHQFIDTTPEDGPTYMRELDPFSRAWIHRTLKPLALRNGDPFGLSSHRLVEQILDHPNFLQIATAMQIGFGPEMNFFDSMAATLDLVDDYLHIYKRLPTDVPDETFASDLFVGADVEGCAFYRKTMASRGRSVQRLFADRARDASSWKGLFWVGRTGKAETHRLSLMDPLLFSALIEDQVEMRDLLGRTTETVQFRRDSLLVSSDGRNLAQWEHDGHILKIDFHDAGHGHKRYLAAVADPEKIILVPDEVVSHANRWSVFLAISINDVRTRLDAHTPDRIVFSSGETVEWFGAADLDAALFSSMAVGEQALELPCLEGQGRLCSMRRCGANWLALVLIDEAPGLLRWHGFTHAAGVTNMVFSNADQTDLLLWEEGIEDRPALELGRADIPGNWTLQTFAEERSVRLTSEGQVLAEDGTVIGQWLWRHFGVQLLGLPEMSLGNLTQTRLHDGRLRLTGHGEARLGQQIFFALCQAEP